MRRNSGQIFPKYFPAKSSKVESWEPEPEHRNINYLGHKNRGSDQRWKCRDS